MTIRPFNPETYPASSAGYRFFDEMHNSKGGARPGANRLFKYLTTLSASKLRLRQAAAERAIVEMGITFSVYTEGQNIDRVNRPGFTGDSKS